MIHYIKSSIIAQAIELGFDFSEVDMCDDMNDLNNRLHDFFVEKEESLEQEEDECEVTFHNRGQSVSYGDYQCDGEIVDPSQHWREAPDHKVYHSDFLYESCGRVVKMNLYYLVDETEYNAPDGYEWCRKTQRHVPIVER
jgi:hypothetical protein